MEGLKTLECCDYIRFIVQPLCLGNKKLLLGKIFLEIIVTKLFVHFPLVIEMLHGILK